MSQVTVTSSPNHPLIIQLKISLASWYNIIVAELVLLLLQYHNCRVGFVIIYYLILLISVKKAEKFS